MFIGNDPLDLVCAAGTPDHAQRRPTVFIGNDYVAASLTVEQMTVAQRRPTVFIGNDTSSSRHS